ncbi:tRNA dimethylallyltransferase 9 [Bienertia sinuspersici]
MAKLSVYRGLDIGSAKPSPSERKEVPHHLLDILHPSEEYSVGQFYEDARQATRDVLNKGHVPIITGGTGLFIYGKPDVPKASRDITSQVYAELENYPKYEDWDAAVKLVVEAGDPNAHLSQQTIGIAYGVALRLLSGSPPSAFQLPYDSFKEQLDLAAPEDCPDKAEMQESQLKDLDYDFICFFLSTPRLDLYKSIDFRCEDMLSRNDGILAEAKWLLDIGLPPNSNSATRAIGYRQGMEYLLRCREQGGHSSAKEFFSFLSEFQKASRYEKVLNFVHDAYHDQSTTLTVPESIRMKKDVANRRETAELKPIGPETGNTINAHIPLTLVRTNLRLTNCVLLLKYLLHAENCAEILTMDKN